MPEEAAPQVPDAPATAVAQAPPAPPSAAARPTPKTPPPKVDHLPPFKVLLHNDDENDMLWVVRTIVELTTNPPQRAVELMLEAHKTGVALVAVTHKERAELYQDQFKSKGLTATIEPAE
jgi:ATP-dependent Clp protease adaptor protein ClpS